MVVFDVPMCRTNPIATNSSSLRHVFMKFS